ncbi:MAG: hypothetical protein [Cressdnaviricota sp.]|nr:MAG: hypothetical protein [Cressdnaviricota sp.]
MSFDSQSSTDFEDCPYNAYCPRCQRCLLQKLNQDSESSTEEISESDEVTPSEIRDGLKVAQSMLKSPPVRVTRQYTLNRSVSTHL